ncbi:MAG: alpha/beta hydrolase [Eubacteriales bacterium]
MRKQKGTFLSAYNGTVIHYVVYEPIGEIKAILQLVHGMKEYIERYELLGEFFAKRGILVCGHDQLGHGITGRENGELGFFAQKQGHRYLIEDVHALRMLVQEQYGNLPIFLFGHSMGSFITRVYLSKYADGLAGCILSGTSGRMKLSVTGIRIADTICKTKGVHHRGKFIDHMAFGAYNVGFEGDTSYEWLSRDSKICESFLVDELCNYQFTSSAFRDLFTLLTLCNQKKWYESFSTKLPLYLMSGTHDPVGLKGIGVKQVYEQLLVTGHRTTMLQLYPEARHELTNEINKEEVYEDLYNWVSTCMMEVSL